MKMSLGLTMVLAAALLVPFAGFAQAAEEKLPEAQAPAAGVAGLATAYSLAAWGVENENVSALLAAAALLQSLPVQETDRQGEESAIADAAADEEKKEEGESPAWTVARLLDAAAELAKGDEALAALVASERTRLEQAQAAMGAGGGPKRDCDYVRAGYQWTYRITFNVGPAEIMARGDGDGDLDLFVYAENGQLLGSDTMVDSNPIVRTYVYVRQPLTIVLKNVGNIGEYYCLFTN